MQCVGDDRCTITAVITANGNVLVLGVADVNVFGEIVNGQVFGLA